MIRSHNTYQTQTMPLVREDMPTVRKRGILLCRLIPFSIPYKRIDDTIFIPDEARVTILYRKDTGVIHWRGNSRYTDVLI